MSKFAINYSGLENTIYKKAYRLEDVKDNKISTAKIFGEKYYEGHEMLIRVSNMGNGSTRGVGMWFHAGKVLKKLTTEGYIKGGRYSIYEEPYFLTKQGKEFIDKQNI